MNFITIVIYNFRSLVIKMFKEHTEAGALVEYDQIWFLYLNQTTGVKKAYVKTKANNQFVGLCAFLFQHINVDFAIAMDCYFLFTYVW